MSGDITVALIAAAPATLAATAAWISAKKSNLKVSTSNGHTLGQLVESHYELTRSTSRRLDEVSKTLEVHVQDQKVHCCGDKTKVK